jgi:hypothetical protein
VTTGFEPVIAFLQTTAAEFWEDFRAHREFKSARFWVPSRGEKWHQSPVWLSFRLSAALAEDRAEGGHCQDSVPGELLYIPPRATAAEARPRKNGSQDVAQGRPRVQP